MPEKKGAPVLVNRRSVFQGQGEAGNVQMIPLKSPANTVRAVEQLLDRGWSSNEVEEALRRQRGSGYFDDHKDFLASASGRVEEDRVTQAMAYIPISDIPDVPLLATIREHTHRLGNLTFKKGKHTGVGFKVTSDAFGKNAIVSKVKDRHLMAKGVCIGAVVTHIDDIEVIGMDHFEILENYRNCRGQFSIMFAVPGLKHHIVDRDPVRKSGHKFTLLLLLCALLLSITSLSTNLLHEAEIKNLGGQKVEIKFGCFDYQLKVDSGDWVQIQYDRAALPNETEVEKDYRQDWEDVGAAGGLFFGFTLFSVIMYILLLILAAIFATRRPRSLIEEMGETLRSMFIIGNMVVCLTTLTTWSAWVSQFEFPEGILVGGSWVSLSDANTSDNISTSTYLQIVAFICMFFSIFTAVVQK